MHYFTGRPCKYGHVSIRYASNGCCAVCIALNSAQGKYKPYYQQYAKARHAAARRYLREQRAKPCTDCRRSFPWYVMEFDHPLGRGNDLTIADAATYGVDRLQREIQQCELVCANCHLERTHQRAVAAGQRHA